MSVQSGEKENGHDDVSQLSLSIVHIDDEAKPICDQMDHWYLEMKKNLLKEFDRIRCQYFEEAEENIRKEKPNQTKEYLQLNEDVKTMREMLVHYEQMIDQKEQTEENLCKAVDLLHQKTFAYQLYYQWRFTYFKKRQENHALALAEKYFNEKLKRKMFNNWKLMIDREWRKIYQTTCEKKSEFVLNDVLHDYQMKYEDLQTKLLVTQDELTRLRSDRINHDETIRQAFLRGVCALNMEAMNVLLKDEHSSINTSLTNSTDDEQRRSSKYPTHVMKETRSLPKSRQMFVSKHS